jgi:hypothetical protein
MNTRYGATLSSLARSLIVGDAVAAQTSLQQILGPRADIQGIALFGSRGRALAGISQVVTEVSDIDGLVVVESRAMANAWKDRLRIATDGGDLDLEVVASIDLSIKPKALAHRFYWSPAYVLWDPSGALANYLNSLSEFVAKGPPPWSESERDRQRSWVDRMLRRIERNLENEALAGHQLCFLKSELLLMARPARGLWSLGPRSTLEWLGSTDRQALKLWSQALSVRSPDSLEIQLQSLRALADWTLNSPAEGTLNSGANCSR